MEKYQHVIIVCLVLFSVFSLYFYIPEENRFAKGADEGYYFKFADIIAEKGISAFPPLIKSYAIDTQAHLYPPPSRVGHILLTALWFKIFGASFISLAKFSFFCYILFILVCFYFSKKIFGKDISYPFTLLVSSSPLIMAMAKRALLDSNVNLFWALSIWSFMDFLISKKKNKFFIFLLIYSFSLIVKESSLVLMVFFIAFFLIHKHYFKNSISDFYLLGIIFIPLVLVGTFYISLLGGIANFISLIKGLLDTHFGSVKLSKYAVLFCNGAWYRYIIDYLLLSPITTLLFIGYTGYILVSRKWEWKITYFLLYFLIIFVVFSSLKYSKVVRFVITLDMVINLCSVIMLYELFRIKNKNKQALWVFISVIAIFFVNYLNFNYLFYEFNIYDPVTYWLLIAKKLIPFM
jgi:hypothetical protein